MRSSHEKARRGGAGRAQFELMACLYEIVVE